MGQQRAWELLRKEARKLESEVDSKLATYGKYDKGFGYRQNDPASEGGYASAVQATQIEDLLANLTRVNEEMVGTVSDSDSRRHTLARHNDILQEYQQEFKRLKSIQSSMQDRADLLGDVESGANAPLLPLSSNSNTILRERANIGNVNNALDDVIGQAQNVASSLMQQRRVFDGVNSKLNMLGARFPVVNSLLTSIRRRKAKDTIVMSIVVAICLTLMIMYLFSR
ncbi:subunit 1 of Golgi SNAP receptor complex [Chloropicon primus]|uniref:Golgi SNAP receptor complex member 1 n=1 Tax=Chloropicon primus TaxID=1764295 RepID=A0A5B8MK17_9CHLO|nr:subunit 1 of Golgi SNAP receptor complex [Chloropicon primus]UPQ99989.1 subunit 1 of Golgi SNAP receptor complex [Chloropicon primus]|mmetsp:Transcript_5735/g.17356  ORF Transcript_5735/g.17356 Transcript_5735/m.17356 type:complete len:226 (-) Transcript_5735:137-814(-)|eukprot:QDZ20777.1 subunit 1 of Golgi SNAP receptor complex [Chloropicon primus]